MQNKEEDNDSTDPPVACNRRRRCPARMRSSTFAQADSPIGMWQTIDDNTHQPKALVQIAEDGDGALTGKVVKGLGANDTPDRRCTACTDERKDQLIKGMTIIKAMKRKATTGTAATFSTRRTARSTSAR